MFSRLASLKNTSAKPKYMYLNNFMHGLNTYDPADKIAKTELAKCINWKLLKGGKKKTRLPLVQYTNTAATGGIKHIKRVNIGGTEYTLLVDASYKLYYLDGNLDATLIGTLEGSATIESYNGVACLFDGSYIKYLDGVSTIKIAYDAGDAYQFDYTSADNDTDIDLGDGTTLGVAQKFTTESWTAGYTIPPVTASAYLSKSGTPNASAITCKIRSFADPSVVLASKVLLADATDLGGTASQYYVEFTDSDITTELSPNTAYFLTLEHTGGSPGNEVNVHCNNIGSGGLAYYGDTDLSVIGNWNADATKNCLFYLSPGSPPKGEWAAIWNKRLFVGGNPDNPGKLNYCNLTHLDWSTSGGGGSIGMIDDDNDTYEVGSAKAFFGNLYVLGTQNQPYLTKISGTEPADYVQELVMRSPWATHKNFVDGINDLWFLNQDGLSPLTGVQEFGDLRTYTASDPVYDRILDYWDANTIIGYYPEDGQVLCVFPTYNRVLVCHSKIPVIGPDRSTTRYPFTEYEFYKHELTSSTYKWTLSGGEYYCELAGGGDPSINYQPDFVLMNGIKLTEGTKGALSDHQWDRALDPTASYQTIWIADASGDPDTTGVTIKTVILPTCFESVSGNFLIGSTDGHIYKLDSSEYKDMANIQIDPIYASSYIELPMTKANFSQIQLMMSSEGGGSAKINFYNDFSYALTAAEKTLTVNDNLTWDELDMDWEDAHFIWNISDAGPLYKYINFNARALHIVVNNVELSGYPIYDNGIILKYRMLRS